MITRTKGITVERTILKVSIAAIVAAMIIAPLPAAAAEMQNTANTGTPNGTISTHVIDSVYQTSDNNRHEKEKQWSAQTIEQLTLLREEDETQAAEEAAALASAEAVAAEEAAYYDYDYDYNDYSGSSGADYSDYNSSGGWKYTEYYPSENTGAFAYAPDLDITLGDDGTYRDQDGYVVVASSSLGKFEEVETPYGTGKLYDTGCAGGIVDIYREG